MQHLAVRDMSLPNFPPSSDYSRTESEVKFIVDGTSWSCRVQLSKAVANRGELDVHYMVKAFACVALSARSLSLTELYDAVATSITAPAISGSEEVLEGLPGSPLELMRLCSDVLAVRRNGDVEFSHNSMRDYLFHAQLLDAGKAHETLARLCLQQLRRAKIGFMLDPKISSWNSLSAFSQHPFLRYACRHWPRHYLAAEGSTNGLPSLLYETIEQSVALAYSAEDHLYIEIRQISLDLALKLSEHHDFQILGDMCRKMGADASRQNCSVLQPSTREEGNVSARLCACDVISDEDLLDVAPSDISSCSPELEKQDREESWVLLPMRESFYDERQAEISTDDTHGMNVVAEELRKIRLLADDDASSSASGSVRSAMFFKQGCTGSWLRDSITAEPCNDL